MTLPLVQRFGLSMVCSGCDGEMVITFDAIGRERYRCPKCTGVAKPRCHPDDAMLPQGLVKGAPPRIIREIVKVEVPLPPERIIELPAIREGQLRCQLCAIGIDPRSRFCVDCMPDGREIVHEMRERRRHPGTRQNKRFREIRCRRVGCETWFTPTGPFARYCEAHR